MMKHFSLAQTNIDYLFLSTSIDFIQSAEGVTIIKKNYKTVSLWMDDLFLFNFKR